MTMAMKTVRPTPRCGESMEAHVARLADAGPTAIEDRLAHLEDEWSVGRTAKATAGVLALGAAAADWMGRRRLGTFLALAAGTALCPYLLSRQTFVSEILCRFGFREGSDIQRERLALRTLRGDFRHVPTLHDVESHDDISRFEGEGGMAALPDERKIDPHEAAAQVLRAV